MEIKIYYQDTDCGGVVYYANYLTYFERARTEFMAERGVSVKEMMDKGFLFVVARAEIDYRSPAKYGETIVVKTCLAQVKGVKLEFSYLITEKESMRAIVEGKTILVCVGPDVKPKKMPQEIIEKLNSK